MVHYSDPSLLIISFLFLPPSPSGRPASKKMAPKPRTRRHKGAKWRKTAEQKEAERAQSEGTEPKRPRLSPSSLQGEASDAIVETAPPPTESDASVQQGVKTEEISHDEKPPVTPSPPTAHSASGVPPIAISDSIGSAQADDVDDQTDAIVQSALPPTETDASVQQGVKTEEISHDEKPPVTPSPPPTTHSASGVPPIAISDSIGSAQADDVDDQKGDKFCSLKTTDDSISIQMDVKCYKPEELKVTVFAQTIVIEGKHGELTDDMGTIERHFIRRIPLPKGVQPEAVTSTLTTDGLLSIVALPPKPKDPSPSRTIPIKVLVESAPL